MSNGNGVTATLSQAAESIKETAGNIGSSIASTAESAATTVLNSASRVRKATTSSVGNAKKKLAAASANGRKEAGHLARKSAASQTAAACPSSSRPGTYSPRVACTHATRAAANASAPASCAAVNSTP